MTANRWPRGLLVSVRDAEEAELAVVAGGSIIDVKEPSHGPLGRADVAVAAAVIAAVGGRAPVTLAGGELAAGPGRIAAHAAELLDLLPPSLPPPTAVKAGPSGLSAAAWCDAFGRLRADLPDGVEAVAVAYADWRKAESPAPDRIIAAAGLAGAATVLVDTFDKQGPGLFEAVPPETVATWTAAAAAAGLTLAVAGRLTPAGVAAAFEIGLRVVGVRSAACDGGRDGRVAAPRVRELVRLSLAVVPSRDRFPPRPISSRSSSIVKPLEVRLPHGLDAAEVRRRLDQGIERARTDYADKVSAIDAAWESDERLRLDLTVMGMSIAGDIDVLPAELVIRLELPMMASLFAGRIRSGLEERLGGLLQAPA